MSAYKGSAYRLYDSFRQDLGLAADATGALEAFSRLLRPLNAHAAAVLADVAGGTGRDLTVSAQIGGAPLWSGYLELCHANNEPLARILRLSPHSVALSDLRRHPRLMTRANQLANLLVHHDMDDAYAVPAIDKQFKFTMMIIAGRNLVLRPTSRHMMTQAAADVIARIHDVLIGRSTMPAPPHLKLTPRQMEIATWLVAGKSDWEIGEILQISPKTVNFHVENIKRAYGVRSRSQFIAAIVHDGGLVPAT